MSIFVFTLTYKNNSNFFNNFLSISLYNRCQNWSIDIASIATWLYQMNKTDIIKQIVRMSA